MSDDEWSLFECFILAIRAPNGRKPINHRLVLDGIFWIARTGSPWRDLPEEFGKWSSVYRQFRRWTLAGLWEDMLEALNQSGAVPDALQMVDGTVTSRASNSIPISWKRSPSSLNHHSIRGDALAITFDETATVEMAIPDF